MTTILVCDTCRYSQASKLLDEQTGGEILAGLVEKAAADGISVKRQSCLMNCKGHCNVAIRAKGKVTYVLGRFEPNADSAEAITEFAAEFAALENGRVPLRDWPQGVKGHFLARLPVIEDDE